ncbi:hypothetical protein B0T18DRAFT_424278 [Schizothecium vesticola]|uniref:Secreted protein n=1 Tax=Schizothecium vesticola TaxID=314040 RepID=A0AA40FAN9_9PEZI|nr:hypothetical protein B0T18DRAFT_424278 [Schizothecium vesticola]
MRFSGLALLSALAAKVSADAMASYTECYFGSCTSHRAVWYTDFGSHNVDANEGCRKGASDMEEMCVDWGNGRGHFRFPNGPRRCFKLERRIDVEFCRDFGYSCTLDAWQEVGCSW